ncbi:MAG: AAA family ATPase [Bacteroidota bacterium]
MKKIVAIGPESTGKSSLCERLAGHYKTSWCPEYAREFLLAHGTRYSYDTLLDIARGQVALEEKYIRQVNESTGAGQLPRLFIDTDMNVMNVWCKFVFGKTHSWILNQLAERKYDLYLLCKTDLPWVKDELREYPKLALREKLYQLYKEIMLNQAVPWVEISGNYEERFDKAVAAVEKLG